MTSHEYANKLKALADFLLSKPEIDANTERINESFWFWTRKDDFLAAVRAMKPWAKRVWRGNRSRLAELLPQRSSGRR